MRCRYSKGPFRIFGREKIYGAQLGLGTVFHEESAGTKIFEKFWRLGRPNRLQSCWICIFFGNFLNSHLRVTYDPLFEPWWCGGSAGDLINFRWWHHHGVLVVHHQLYLNIRHIIYQTNRNNVRNHNITLSVPAFIVKCFFYEFEYINQYMAFCTTFLKKFVLFKLTTKSDVVKYDWQLWRKK